MDRNLAHDSVDNKERAIYAAKLWTSKDENGFAQTSYHCKDRPQTSCGQTRTPPPGKTSTRSAADGKNLMAKYGNYGGAKKRPAKRKKKDDSAVRKGELKSKPKRKKKSAFPDDPASAVRKGEFPKRKKKDDSAVREGELPKRKKPKKSRKRK